ncbi:enoyl-CoA hydratase/isomerase family protein [Nocardioides sp. LHD-245]|uniref:enoyl-CoA hydratase/isomerase family protein n=1 Tax=Nocardioides sp. LHD-245 TaxID=3051387 RepID=UPI0027DFAAFE|nr:enoyl-CoA hydratase/isomerase family protein [Nocardioides sp. LHD-245]
MGERRIELDLRPGAALLTLDRPERLNALDPQMLEELLDAVRVVARSDARALVITGRGRLFSAGVDLDTPFFMEHVDDPSIYSGKRLLDGQHEIIEAIHGLPIPTLAALNGHACGGGGLGIAMACDLRFAVSGARLWMVPGALDVVQDFGLSWLVQRQVGASRALHMALTGYRVSAEEALTWGLVNEVLPDAEALGAAVEGFLARVAGQGADAVRMLKTVVRLGESSSLREQLQVEAIANGLAFQSEEFAAKKKAYLDELGAAK